MGARYQDIRLSKHFVLLDFMYGREVYTSRRPLPLETCVTQENIRNGRYLCDSLLEPCIAGWGPCSTGFGLVPEPMASDILPETRPRPHKWVDRFGAAADVVWHDQDAEDVAPIDLCAALDRSNLPYERLITYAGSEVMCMNAKAHDPAYKLYENVRTGVGCHQYCNHGTSFDAYRVRSRAKVPEPLTNWRRGPDERTHAWRPGAAHHTRVGRYFMFLDFCRNEGCLRSGAMAVPAATGNPLRVARGLAAILDPLVAQVGRISVTKGGWWPIRAATYEVKFLLPLGVKHPPECLHSRDLLLAWGGPAHPSGGLEISLTVEDRVIDARLQPQR